MSCIDWIALNTRTCALCMLVMLFASVSFSAKSASYVYVGNAGSASVSVYKLDTENLSLNLIEHKAIGSLSDAGFSTPMAISHTREQLYIATRGGEKLLARFKISSDSGALTLINTQALEHSYAYIAFNPSESALIGASYPQNLARSWRINDNGNAEPVDTHKGLINAHAVVFVDKGRLALIPTLGNNQLSAIAMVDGSFTKVKPSLFTFPDNTGPRHLRVLDNTNILYVLGELDARVHVLKMDEVSGEISLLQSLALPIDWAHAALRDNLPSAADIHISGDGKFLFATERRTNSLCSFAVLEDSLLQAKQCVQTEEWPRGFAIDREHELLIVAGQRSHHVSVYKMNKGELSFVSRVPTQEGPNYLEIVHF
ncbi:lactonase family protein [Ningiella sp. W23]|uniref:lactonase family protein n=1 Tax=Ningiella sp. W23 TaxID=3023715 RepID=UPI0037565D0F